MKKKNQIYPEEFKREALKLASNSDVSVAQVERDLGITSGLIYKWRERYRMGETTDELKPSAEREVEAEIRCLKRELIAREERDILKKASSTVLCWSHIDRLKMKQPGGFTTNCHDRQNH